MPSFSLGGEKLNRLTDNRFFFADLVSRGDVLPLSSATVHVRDGLDFVCAASQTDELKSNRALPFQYGVGVGDGGAFEHLFAFACSWNFTD